jgi:hypothetical protein
MRPTTRLRARKNPDDTLTWTPHVGGKVYGASGKVTLESKRVVNVSLRVDARDESNIRVDMATLGLWEAIDDGEGFSTVGEAQRFAKAWLKAAQAEGTLSPRVPRNIRDMGPLEGVFARKNPETGPGRRPRKNPGKLDSCTRQYLETAMWASTDDNDVSLDKEFSITDFAPEAIEKARKACDEFCDNNDVSEIENDQVGHYLWLSRNGHGAGFFDIKRDDLQKAARKLGEVDIYVGDDGLLYFSR